MTQESAFRRFIPKPFWKQRREYVKEGRTPPLKTGGPAHRCRGSVRAAMRRVVNEGYEPWRLANEEAAPHRAKIVERNVEALKLAAMAHNAWLKALAAWGGKRA